MKARVIKEAGGKFFLLCDDGRTLTCHARGRIKRDDMIFVGDFVEVSEEKNGFVIDGILPRKNKLIRPYVANVDVVVILIACEPEPDFLLVDKLLVDAAANGIEPVIAVNKCDLDGGELYAKTLKQYGAHFRVTALSAVGGEGIDELRGFADGKLIAFAGQSAVGKSSLINALGNLGLQTGGLSKVGRGRHTTRRAEIFDAGTFTVADTCGFSMLETEKDFDPITLKDYYPEFENLASQCRFRGCTHTDEPDCAVKRELGKSVDEARYERYTELYKSLKDKWRKRYD